MAWITTAAKAQLEKDMRESLRSLGLLDGFKLSVRSTRSSFFVSIEPKSRFNELGCGELTVRGKQCRIDPEPGERYCLMHLKIRKEREDA